MRWKDRKKSKNVEDRRRVGGLPGGKKGGLSIGAVLVAVVAFLMTKDPSQLIGLGASALQAGQVSSGSQRQPTASENERAEFVSVILGDTEVVWEKLFQSMGLRYEPTTLVLFAGSTSTACGLGESAIGPFYCPGDQNVYIDLAFFDQMAKQLGAPGDFAQAYVVAHEVGHHIQNLLGTSGRVSRQQRGLSEADSNELSVRLELQADFYAGVWARHAEENWGVLERGDFEEALQAAQMIGDDTLQRRAGRQVQPETFTHGTSEQRVRWFQKGFETGDPEQGDTFSARRL